MSQSVKSTSTVEKAMSIHDMLKDTPPSNNGEVRRSNNVPTVQINPIGQYTSSRSVPIGLSSSGTGCTSSPAILTPSNTTVSTNLSHNNHQIDTNTNGDDNVALRSTTSRIENIKNWSISTYKCTKQLMFEKLGKSTRTVDTELELQIDQLRETQKKYSNILRLAKALASHFYHVLHTQHALGEAFAEMAQKSPELQDEFLYNAETQRNLYRNGEILLATLNFFISSVNTLCNKTIEDTLNSIRQYEAARIEYDAYRTDLDTLTAKSPDGSNSTLSSGSSTPNLDHTRQNCQYFHQQFIKLRTEVTIKMKFLDENRVKVMHKQLILFHNAIAAYFSGNQQALEGTLKQFSIKLITPKSSNNLSWIEQ